MIIQQICDQDFQYSYREVSQIFVKQLRWLILSLNVIVKRKILLTAIPVVAVNYLDMTLCLTPICLGLRF